MERIVMEVARPVCSEFSTSNGYVPPRSYALSGDGKSLFLLPSSANAKVDAKSPFLTTCKQTLAEIFLPYGYPESVSSDYLIYQFWDTVQAFCSSLVGTLATHAVLTGLGVGSEDATPMAATLTWLMKDGLGMVGRITFVWFRGCDLDNDLKRWRFVADILNDAAFFIDMLSAAVPKFLFTPMVCFSSASRAIVGVAGGATRTALVQHQARRGNAADVSAKDGSQETIVNLSALIFSMLLVPAVVGSPLLVWTMYAILTFFHLYANYQAVRSLRLQTFNDKRLAIVMNHFLKENKTKLPKSSLVPDVDQVNHLEPILTFTYGYGCDVKIGVSLAEFFECFDWSVDIWAKLQSVFRNEQFIVILDRRGRKIRAVLNRRAESKDVIFCGYVCYVLSYSELTAPSSDINTAIEHVFRVYEEAVKTRAQFFEHASLSGWTTTEHNLTVAGSYRFEQDLLRKAN